MIKRNKERGEIFLLFGIGVMLLFGGAAVAMKVHDPFDQVDWAPSYEQEPNSKWTDEEWMLYQMDANRIKEENNDHRRTTQRAH